MSVRRELRNCAMINGNSDEMRKTVSWDRAKFVKLMAKWETKSVQSLWLKPSNDTSAARVNNIEIRIPKTILAKSRVLEKLDWEYLLRTRVLMKVYSVSNDLVLQKSCVKYQSTNENFNNLCDSSLFMKSMKSVRISVTWNTRFFKVSSLWLRQSLGYFF